MHYKGYECIITTHAFTQYMSIIKLLSRSLSLQCDIMEKDLKDAWKSVPSDVQALYG